MGSNKEQDLRDVLNLPPELDDFKEVLLQAARSGKYKPNNWLEPEGGKQDKTTQYNSISHHINKVLLGDYIDEESGLDHRLHAACRLLMDYTRSKRGIIHPIDGKKAISNNIGKLSVGWLVDSKTGNHYSIDLNTDHTISHTTPFMQDYINAKANLDITQEQNKSYLESIRGDLTRSGNEAHNTDFGLRDAIYRNFDRGVD